MPEIETKSSEQPLLLTQEKIPPWSKVGIDFFAMIRKKVMYVLTIILNSLKLVY